MGWLERSIAVLGQYCFPRLVTSSSSHLKNSIEVVDAHIVSSTTKPRVNQDELLVQEGSIDGIKMAALNKSPEHEVDTVFACSSARTELRFYLQSTLRRVNLINQLME